MRILIVKTSSMGDVVHALRLAVDIAGIDKCTYRCTLARMAKVYSVAAARARLPEILDEVESGREVRLSRRGRLVAVVLSGARYEALRAERMQFRDSYRNFVQRHSLVEIGLEGDFFDFVREEDSGRRVRL